MSKPRPDEQYSTGFNRRQRRFTSLENAKRQADALANFHAGAGRFLVFEENGTYLIRYDPVAVRYWAEEDHVYEAHQHANSGMMTWKDASTFGAGRFLVFVEEGTYLIRYDGMVERIEE